MEAFAVAEELGDELAGERKGGACEAGDKAAAAVDVAAVVVVLKIAAIGSSSVPSESTSLAW